MTSDLGLDPIKTPIIAGEMVHKDQGGLLAGMNSIVNQLPDVLDNSYVISSSGCTDQDDNIHFNAAGYRELGKRYGETMLEVMDHSSIALTLSSGSSGQLELHSNYPNPAGDFTKISFSLPAPSDVSIELLDSTGKSIQVISSYFYERGAHSINYDLSELSSGVYFYSLKSSHGSIQKKLVVQ